MCTVANLVKANESKSKLSKSYWRYKKIWNYLEIKYDVLWKREESGKLVFIAPFSFLIDLSAKLHLSHAHVGTFKLTCMVRKLIWHHSLVKVVRDLCRTCSICQKSKVSSRVNLPPTLRIHTTHPL